jgi:FkbM family methyltransferase
MFNTTFGLIRSLLMYYGIPFRAGRMARFYAQFLKPGDLAFDVGAHAGNRIRAFRQSGARVVAIEPQPVFADLLQRLYGRDPQVTLIREAVGASPGQADLLVSRRTPTVTTLSAEWVEQVSQVDSFAGVTWDDRVRVPVTTLDALIGRFGLPAFCKIDIEGYELEALRGLSQPVPALSIEYIPATPDLTLDCIERLETLGQYAYTYSIGETHRLAPDGWVDAAAISGWLRSLPPAARSGDLYARLK